MIFKNFRWQVLSRAILMAIAIGVGIYFFMNDQLMSASIALLVTIVVAFQLLHYVESTNRKVTFFLESIENSDFTVKFSRDNKYGKSFQDLNLAFNQVLDAFKDVRAEKEAHLQYLHTVVQYVRIGLISFDQEGKVELYNNAAIQLLGTGYIRNISELEQATPEFYKILKNINPGDNTLVKQSHRNEEFQLSITATELRLRGTAFKLVTIQNIQPELQQKEIEAWQNLAKVLRHEIMNSITPIVSHVETLNEILEDDSSWVNNKQSLTTETTKDITSALVTIEKRSKGLLHFVDAYRSFSEIPKPSFEIIKVSELLDRLVKLYQGETKKLNIKVVCKIDPGDLEIRADQELIDTVLINLFKNALEAVTAATDPTIELRAQLDNHGSVYIEIKDNGPGIIPEAQDRIFIPFYTTKENGSGIGLSLSRQIMQMHHGNLTFDSEPDQYTVFTLQF